MRDLKTSISRHLSVAPGSTLQDTTPVEGDWVDLGDGIGPCVAVVALAAASGSPTAQAHAVKVREADDDSGTNAADIDDATATLTDDDSVVVIRAKNRSKRYVQVHITPAFTGGTSPTNTACGVVESLLERF